MDKQVNVTENLKRTKYGIYYLLLSLGVVLLLTAVFSKLEFSGNNGSLQALSMLTSLIAGLLTLGSFFVTIVTLVYGLTVLVTDKDMKNKLIGLFGAVIGPVSLCIFYLMLKSGSGS